MGLDISVFCDIKKIEPQPSREYYGDGAYLDQHPYFKKQADGIESGWYSYESSYGFRAGSYGGYNQWRESLASLVGLSPEEIWQSADKFDGKPFVELINFPDCEGVIGPQTSAKLLKDFKDFEDKAKEVRMYGDTDEEGKPLDEWMLNYFYNKYQEWMKAFELASNNGAVSFH